MVTATIFKNQKLTYLRHGLSDFNKIWLGNAVCPGTHNGNHTNTDIQAMLMWLTVPFMIFAVFDPSPLTLSVF